MCACNSLCVPELPEEILQSYVTKAEEMLGLVLKDKQYKSVCHFCCGNNVFVLLLTDYGNSVMYTILPSVFDNITGQLLLFIHGSYVYSYIYVMGKSGCIVFWKSGCIVLCISLLAAIMIEQKKKFAAQDIKTEFVGEVQVDNSAKERVVKGQVQ